MASEASHRLNSQSSATCVFPYSPCHTSLLDLTKAQFQLQSLRPLQHGLTKREMTKMERSVRRCSWCGCRLSSDQEGPYCSPCRKSLPRPLSDEERLRGFASFYGYGGPEGEEGSLRRFREHVEGTRDPHVLGLGWDRDMGLICHCEPGDLRGPIPDVRTRYLLPPGSKWLSFESCPGNVSGRLRWHSKNFKRSHPWVEVAIEEGCSGVIYKIATD